MNIKGTFGQFGVLKDLLNKQFSKKQGKKYKANWRNIQMDEGQTIKSRKIEESKSIHRSSNDPSLKRDSFLRNLEEKFNFNFDLKLDSNPSYLLSEEITENLNQRESKKVDDKSKAVEEHTALMEEAYESYFKLLPDEPISPPKHSDEIRDYTQGELMGLFGYSSE